MFMRLWGMANCIILSLGTWTGQSVWRVLKKLQRAPPYDLGISLQVNDQKTEPAFHEVICTPLAPVALLTIAKIVEAAWMSISR